VNLWQYQQNAGGNQPRKELIHQAAMEIYATLAQWQ
jgi:hypothetical protein